MRHPQPTVNTGAPRPLAGPWQVRYDPLSQGLASKWWQDPPTDGWKDIPVPSAWQAVLGPESNGLAWYRTTLDADQRRGLEGTGRRVMLRLESVATDCMIWLNSVPVGRHTGDYLPFEFDLAPALVAAVPGQPLVLLVRIDQYHAPRPPKGVVVENGHITKGFHDVLSLQHAGIWGPVSIRRCGSAVIPPNGISAIVSADGREVAVRVEWESAEQVAESPPTGRAVLHDPSGALIGEAPLHTVLNSPGLRATLTPAEPLAPWSSESPVCYRLSVELQDASGASAPSDVAGITVARRTIETSAAGEVATIRLNGRPLHVRGVLYWGHEPQAISPAPACEEVEAEFARLRAMGFNCVCFCMYYPPDYVYDVADRTGMLVWQEHPVWKSRMTPEFMPEYRRLYQAFMRRDREHPSVIIVSGTCEHEAYDPDLAAWWWHTARAMLPDKLLQIQTGFLEQTQPEFTDLFDDHVYDNCGRWLCFLADMQQRIAELGSKPFVMGETIISNFWPNLAAMKDARAKKPWWLSHGLGECEALEVWLARQYDTALLNRFRRQAAAFALEFRKFQTEALRSTDGFAGFVTNSIRDVPICRIGLRDDLGAWRWSPEDTRSWLADHVVLVRTPTQARAFEGGSAIEVEFAVTEAPSRRAFRVSIDGLDAGECVVKPSTGKLAWTRHMITLAKVAADAPARVISLRVQAGAPAEQSEAGAWSCANEWKLVALPALTWPKNVRVHTGQDLNDQERRPEFEERAYSSGWCLECRSWAPRTPTAASLFPDAALWAHGDKELDPDTLLVTPRLTRAVQSHLTRGGRVLLLAHRHRGGLNTKWINLWGQLPLIVEDSTPHWPIKPGESDAVAAMLPLDLTRWTTRAIPVDDLGITEHMTPVIRYVYTHDSGTPKIFDAVTTARVHDGFLVATCLDHTTAAGRFMLSRLAWFAAAAPLAPGDRDLDITPFLHDTT